MSTSSKNPTGTVERLAAHSLTPGGDRTVSLHAFDQAAELLPDQPASEERPYVALDAVHLAHWRGHALARLDRCSSVLQRDYGLISQLSSRTQATMTKHAPTPTMPLGSPPRSGGHASVTASRPS